MIIMGSMVWWMMIQTSNCLFLIWYYTKKSLSFHNILVSPVEEEYISIMYDDSNVSDSDSEVEDMRLSSCKKTHCKPPVILSILDLSGIYLKEEKWKGKAWCCVLRNKESNVRNGIKGINATWQICYGA